MNKRILKLAFKHGLLFEGLSFATFMQALDIESLISVFQEFGEFKAGSQIDFLVRDNWVLVALRL